MRPFARTLSDFVRLVVALVLLLPIAAHATQIVGLSVEETVRRADAIVVGTVTGAQSRWGDASRRWMLTDYDVAVEEVLLASGQGHAIGNVTKVTYWGGTIGEETHAIAEMRLPRIGERVLLMLRTEWPTQMRFAPTVGLDQGFFSIGAPSSGDRVIDASGGPLAHDDRGNVVRGGTTDATPGPGLDASAFLGWLRANIRAIKDSPPPQAAPIDRSDPRVMTTFAKTPVIPQSSGLSPGLETLLPRGGGAAPASSTPSPTVEKRLAVQTVGEIARSMSKGKYTWANPAGVPIVVNSFPASFAPWYPEDQYQMSKWNYYANEVFRVYTTPTGTYGWPNGVFDLAGWPSSADMLYMYGSAWESNTIGICYSRWINGRIIEADIALNPAFAFTLDDQWVYEGSYAQGFRQTMIHELGHMWGLRHEFNYLSVMNYMQDPFRAFAMPYADDAQAVRTAFPSIAVPRTDLALYLYWEADYQYIQDAFYPSSVIAGQPLTVSYYHMENTGTTTIATPTVEWYLTSARNYNFAYYFLGTSTHGSLAPFTFFTPSGSQRTFTVPANVPSGFYYLAAYIRNDAGAGQTSFPYSNNFAFSRFSIQVTGIVNPTMLLTVTKTGNGSGGVSSTPSGINCGTSCTASFNTNSLVTLVATASSGSAFTGWSGGGCSGIGNCIVTMDTAKTVTASFVLANDQFPQACAMPPGWTKPFAANAGWSVAVDQSFEGACSLKSDAIEHGQKAQVSVTALFGAGNVTFRRRVSSEPGWDYFRFYIDGVEQGPSCLANGTLACSGAAATGATASGDGATSLTNWTQPAGMLSYPVPAGVHTLTFSYEKDAVCCVSGADAAWIDNVTLPPTSVFTTLTAAKTGAGTGLVTSSPAGIVCGPQCSATFASGAMVTLSAAADLGSAFAGWSGGGCSGYGSCIVTMDASRTVTANFIIPTGVFPKDCRVPPGWTTPSGANVGWSAALDQAFEGSCSLKSGPVSHNQKSQVQYTGLFRSGNITFKRRVLSETGYDFFRFYIDGELQGPACPANGTAECTGINATGASTSGDTNWNQPVVLSYPISAGMHTITFSYEKSADGQASADAAWIDAVSLPLVSPASRRADFDGDGRADLPWRHTDGRHALWLMNGLGVTSTAEIIGAGTGWNAVQMADFNGDGRADVVWQHTDGRAAIYLMNGTGAMATQQILNAGGGWSITHTPDLNGDGKADILFQNTNGSVAVWTMNSTTVTGSSGIMGPGTGWSVAHVADFDGDGNEDLLWKQSDGRHAIWLMNGTGVKGTAQILNAGAWTATHTPDLNGDGKADILWKHADGTLASWMMNGMSVAAGSGLMGAGSGWSITRAGDFDGDGRMDLFFMHADGRAAIWMMNGLVPTQTTQLLNAGGGWSAKRVADLNGDGKSDIVWENVDGRAAVWLMNGTSMMSGAGILNGGTGWSVTSVSQ